ncbi:methyltransferase family protein [Motilibacter peucedani]|uniref:Methyltransferase family protein n=1 Tax=Motilibacter peucedani TaxID=598650 RepID=A0A420XKG6_9ACTN|nr:methyltransferase domain-containing protein [Motilibacter peucedani]RKS68510.1 methyltransferase family protein [Motilibacter peucedani]
MSTPLTDYLVTARTFEEYLEMFALDLPTLAGQRVLDCPGGAASFAADGRRHGVRVTALDPAYALAPGDLAVRALDDVRTGADHVAGSLEAYDWSSFGSPEAHRAARTAAAGRFALDLRRRPGDYVAGSLPDTGLPAESFDLVLSSHLLFTYADRLDAAFHRAAVRELLRVLRPGGELRVFPLVDLRAHRPDLVDEVVADVRSSGTAAAEAPVRYRFQRGADSMLLLRKGVSAPSGCAGPRHAAS